MPRVSLAPLLRWAKAAGYIIGSFNVFNLETAAAVIGAAEEVNAPVVLAVAQSHLKYVDLDTLSAAIVRAADRSRVPVVLHLDHGQDLATVSKALAVGFTSVMFDGYGLPWRDKVKQTRSVVDIAHALGVSVEAELGHITKVGVDANQRGELLVDVGRARDFYGEAPVDVIAAAVGTVHGVGSSAPAEVDWRLLDELQSAVPCYVSLHGGSALSTAQIGTAREHGVAKISYFTGLSEVATGFVTETLASNPKTRLPVLMDGVRHAIARRVLERLTAFGSAGRAAESATG